MRLLAIFESRGVRVLNCSYDSSDDTKDGFFAALLVLGLKDNSDSETLGLVEKLMDTRIVSSVEFSPLKGRAFTSFRYPLLLWSQARGVMVQPGSLLIALTDTSSLGSKALRQAGRRYGHSTIHEAKAEKRWKLGLDFVSQIMKATGWGICKIEENERREFTVNLQDPAFAIDSEREGDFVAGLLQGMMEEISDRTLKQDSQRFDGKANSLVVRLSTVKEA